MNNYIWHGNPEVAECSDGGISYLSENYDNKNNTLIVRIL
jgi:hypothetical protein